MIRNNQRKFYRELNQEGERCDDEQQEAEESKKFWEDICNESLDLLIGMRQQLMK